MEDPRESGGVPSTATAIPVPATDTAGVELAGATIGVASAKPEALEPEVVDEAGQGPNTEPREDSSEAERTVEALPKAASSERVWPLRKTPQVGGLAVLVALEGAGACQPGEEPPGGENFKSKRPVEASKANAVGMADCLHTGIHESRVSTTGPATKRVHT
jgi:hypothetical protein